MQITSISAALKSNKGQLLAYVVLASIILLYLMSCIYIYNFHVDDTYISLRYAKNLVNYGQLSFNPGEQPAEGYSNFLLVLIEALFIKIGVENVVNIPKVTGIISGILTIYFTYRISNKVINSDNKLIPYLPPLAVAVATPFIVWSVGGLETVLFTFLIMAGIDQYVVSLEADRPSKHYYLTDLFFFAATLCRPEGAMFWVLSYLYTFINYKNFKISERIKSMIMTFFLIGSYFVWKYYYFGDILPLTYYVKHKMITMELLSGGFNKFIYFLKRNLNILYFIMLIIAVPFSIKKRFKPIIYMTILLLCYLLYTISLGKTVFMDQVYRFYVVILPLLYIVGGYGIDQLLKRFFVSNNQFKYYTVLLLSCIQIWAGWNYLSYAWNTDFGWGNPGGMAEYVDNFKDNWEQAGGWIAKRVPPGSTIVLGDIGAIGYYSNLKIIDSWSLNDKQIIQFKNQLSEYVPGTSEYEEVLQNMRNYILIQSPEIIILQNIDLRPDPRFTNNYIRVSHPFRDVDRDFPAIYVRKDLVQ